MNNLKAINISKTYSIDGYEIEVLKNLNLIVEKGDTVAISGQSGSGKSTLLQLLALLDKQSSGSIELNNEVMDDLTSNQKSKIRLNNFGFVYQHHHLLEDLTVYENIALPLKLKGDLQNLDIKVRDLAKSIGLSERLNHLPWKLSGGEKQRVAVARAMINKPEYIFLDEPTGNLDKKNALNIQNLVLELSNNNDVALIVATHDNDFVNILDRKYYLDNRGLIEL
ncbi:ABC transporter ATP-binding protein [bacterium]|jgi:lipoprotein-releasing system ATP-binding protein|nr:ABC transporter ATP-binding protein [bacterium]MDA7828440.1 ABC transporter ATP-binding protein [Gammaproteobacteria bacterium]MDA9997311.1 ABC transporter ATP-binding protein [Gammaproteobacteria bacterium]MDC0367772.1 ABC transporter ATP-binding protein [Gammaproteobacteria bacterium]MDC3248137.1 ABC transporter ATP-binding protein [Gammaproteobacteria bacterium]